MSGIGDSTSGSTTFDENAPILNPTTITNDDQSNVKIDPITSLQDAIDGLSLAMFEALRGLRDAVAPESGSLQQQQQDSALTDPTKKTNDTDALWMAYCNNEPDIVEQMNPYILKFLRKKKMKNSGSTSSTTGSNVVGRNAKMLATTNADVIKKEQFVRLYTKMQYDKDSVLVQKLANDVLEKSKQIDIAVDDYVVTDPSGIQGSGRVGCTIPGMHRTRSEQLRYIEQLIHDNQMASNELNTLHHVCIEQRDKCRQYVRQTTAVALDIYEE